MSSIRSLLPLFLVVSAAACAADSSTEPSALPTVSANHLAGMPVTRLINGSCTLTAEAVEPLPFTPPLFEPIIHLEIEGVCNLKHLGQTTVVSTEEINLITGVVTNTATWTAANGDQIMSEFTGNGTTNGVDATFGGVITYVSGTGRFQDVSGTLNLEGSSHFDGLAAVGEYRMDGTITY